MSRRIKQVNELLKRELSSLIKPSAKGYLLTVTEVDIAPDLRDAKVWVSVFSSIRQEGKLQDEIKNLQAQEFEFRKILLRRLSLKYIPRLNFVLYEVTKKASR